MPIPSADERHAMTASDRGEPRLPLGAAAAVIAAGSALGWAALIWLAAAI
jgi:hypothetical protein